MMFFKIFIVDKWAKCTGWIFVALICFSPKLLNGQIEQEPNIFLAHAHNDYEQKRPLYLALENNFESIEIDIIRQGEDLVVTHDKENLNQKPRIENLYLEPLYKIIGDRKTPLWLLVDIKIYDKQTLDVLHKVLLKNDAFYQRRDRPDETKPLQVVLSGDIPRKEIMENPDYYFFFIDGRPSDLSAQYDAYYMPMISTNFTNYTLWKGRGKMDKISKDKIKALVQQVHDQGKKLRFWKTKDRRSVWRTLQALGLGVIGADRIPKLSRFRKKNK